jgi:DNA invertase Pin-like site-specific DNA recombinase
VSQPRSHQSDVTAALSQLRRLRNPARRAAAATRLLEQLAELEREISAIRDDAVRRLREQGESYGGIASRSGLTRSRVAQLLNRKPVESSGDPALP